jgi:hypothetical protein
MIPLRLYAKPELWVEAFDVDDVITASIPAPPGGVGSGDDIIQIAPAPVIEEAADAAAKTTLFPESTVANPSGAFQHQVTGGNIIQEGLNNIYENFLNRF